MTRHNEVFVPVPGDLTIVGFVAVLKKKYSLVCQVFGYSRSKTAATAAV